MVKMCLFTNNKTNLINGVNSMYPYGLTACYDAIITSIKNASVQSGTRCVIVFTDGADNESRSTVNDVINLANAKSVPVYTIGVGRDVEESELRRIANSTGGTYHHIDDISAMSKVYDELNLLIEGQQKGRENTDVFMVGEQLKDIGAESEHNAEILLQDLALPNMGRVAAAAKLKAYADKNRGISNCVCISPKVADGILREFYGLESRAEMKERATVQDSGFIDLEAFL